MDCRDGGSSGGAGSLRYPDLTIACGPRDDEDGKALREPRVIMEVLSPGTRGHDETDKLAEYLALPSVETVVPVDPLTERVRVVQRLGPDEWNDRRHSQPADVPLPALGLSVPHTEIFARD